MNAYYSVAENVFIGVAPLGAQAEALQNALNFAKGFYRTEFILHEVVDGARPHDELNEYAAIRARPKPIETTRESDQKEVIITSGDPQEVIYVPEGGDIATPFFKAEQSSMVATKRLSECEILYTARIRPVGYLHHSTFF